MRPPPKLVLIAAVCAAFVTARAGEEGDLDQATEARLLALEGKFREADSLLARAAPEVRDDPKLRLALGEMAMKYAHAQAAEARRGPLFSARMHFSKVIEVTPGEAKAAIGVMQAAQELTQLDVDARLFDEAKNETKAAIESGEKALTAGISTPEFKSMLGRMYAMRASFTKSMKDVDLLVSDTTKGAALLADAAGSLPELTGRLLSEASAMRLRAANLIHEGIPVDAEKRDDEALVAALDLATLACNKPSASEADFATHLSALRLAHSWGIKVAQKPYMTLLGPPLEGLKLELPRSGGWNRAKSPDWDLLLERNLGDPKNDGTVQIMLKQWKAGDMSLGKSWGQLAEMAPRRFDKYKEDQAELGSVVEPVQLGGSKTAPDLWHYEVQGKVKSGRTERIAEWIWADKKKDCVWQMKVIDWRPVPDVEDPDIVAFVASAIGQGLWPPGSAGPKGKDDPKDPKEPPKKPPPPPKKGK